LPGVAGLLNVTFGNAPELIIAFFALLDGLQEVVKATLVGSVIGNSLLVLGAAMLAGPDFDAHPRQRVIQVTEAVTITGDKFEFVQNFRGLEVLSPKGTLIGRDNGREVRTPYDDCVLIMPSRRLAKGQTAVRLGRYVD